MQTALPNEVTLEIRKTIDIDAPPAVVWESMLDQIGPSMRMPNGQAFPLKLEPWPGGRYFRDLGNNAGHFWAHVQVIKPPSVLELWGPLMMSYPAVNHVQYRITARGAHSTLTILHRAMGMIDPEHRRGMPEGWDAEINNIRKAAETAAHR